MTTLHRDDIEKPDRRTQRTSTERLKEVEDKK